MKVNLGQGVGIKSGSAQVKQTNFSIGNASVIIEILRNNFYQNKIQTLVQEYICNGRDAVREKLREQVIKSNKALNPEKEQKELQKLSKFDGDSGEWSGWIDEEKAKQVLAKVDEKEAQIREKINELYGKDGQPTIEVTVPTKFDSTFKVRDYGVGISPERMDNVFVKYGVSTKRYSNTETGGFGIGAKSAWAYTSAFTIITYIDGVQRTYVAHIGDNQNGALRFRGECSTDQPNGTEIWIPLNKETVDKDILSFRDATFRATQFWKVKPLVKGMVVDEYPKCYKGVESLFNGDSWGIFDIKAFSYFNTYSDSTRMVAVIDGVPYIVANQYLRLTNVQKVLQYVNGYKMIVLELNNGDVEVVANREQLGDSPKSLEKFDEICGKIHQSIQQEIQRRVNSATNLKEYIAVHLSINGILQKNIETKYTLDNVEYKMDSTNALDSVHLAKTLISYYRNEKQRKGDKVILKEYPKATVSFGRSDNNNNAVFMYNDGQEKDWHIREKARVLAQGEENKKVFVINKNQLSDDEFKIVIKHLNIVPSSSVELPVIEKGERKKRDSNKGKMCFHKVVSGYGRSAYKTESLHISEEEFLSSDKTFLYIPMNEGKVVPVENFSQRDFYSLTTYLNAHSEFTVVALNDKVWEKVKRQKKIMEFKKFLSKIEEYVKLDDKHKAQWIASRLTNHPFSNMFQQYPRLVDQIKDPLVKDTWNYFTKIRNTRTERFPCDYIQNNVLPKMAKDLEKEVNDYNLKVTTLNDKYSLINYSSYGYQNRQSIMEDIILFCNAKFEKLTKK